MSEKEDIQMPDKILLSNENSSDQPSVILNNKNIEYKQHYCDNCHKEDNNIELKEHSIKKQSCCLACILNIRRHIICYTSNKKIELSKFDNVIVNE